MVCNVRVFFFLLIASTSIFVFLFFFRLLNWELGKREDSHDSKMCCR